MNILSILVQFSVVVKTFHYKFEMKLFKIFVFLRNSWFGQEVPVFSQEVLGSQQEVLSPAQKSSLFNFSKVDNFFQNETKVSQFGPTAYYNVKVFIFL